MSFIFSLEEYLSYVFEEYLHRFRWICAIDFIDLAEKTYKFIRNEPSLLHFLILDVFFHDVAEWFLHEMCNFDEIGLIPILQDEYFDDMKIHLRVYFLKVILDGKHNVEEQSVYFHLLVRWFAVVWLIQDEVV